MCDTMLEMRLHAIAGFPVYPDTTTALATAHQVFRPDWQRFVDANFLPHASAPYGACVRFDHLRSSLASAASTLQNSLPSAGR